MGLDSIELEDEKSVLIKGDSGEIILREKKKGFYVVDFPKGLD